MKYFYKQVNSEEPEVTFLLKNILLISDYLIIAFESHRGTTEAAVQRCS